MEIETREIDGLNLSPVPGGVIILPSNIRAFPGEYEYSSSAPTLAKFLRRELGVEFYSPPERILEQRSGDWYAPLLLISQALISENPLVINILCGLISNYISDRFNGIRKPAVHLSFLVEKKSTPDERSKYIQVSYSGSNEELKAVIDAIVKVAKDD